MSLGGLNGCHSKYQSYSTNQRGAAILAGRRGFVRVGVRACASKQKAAAVLRLSGMAGVAITIG